MWFFRGYPPSPSHGFGAYKTPFVLLQFHWLYSRIRLVRFGFIFALKLFVAFWLDFVCSFIFVYFPCYFCCLNMPQYLAWQRLWQRQQPPRDPGPLPGQVQQTFPTANISFTFVRLPGHFLHLHPLPLSLSLFVSDPLSQTLAGMCVCFPVCLRLFLAFMELIKTSLCSFGKKRKKKITIKKGEPKTMFNVVFGPKT